MDAVNEIKQRADIIEIISSYLPLKKAGRNFTGLCPFHTEKTASFVVFPHTQSWHCFGACGTGGDVFTFIMQRENMDFAEALRFLAQRVGVTLEPRTPEKAQEEEKRRKLQEINALAAGYYHDRLLRSDEAARAREYLKGRGISPETVGAFQLGYALSSWRALTEHMVAKGYREQDLLDAGLLSETEDGRKYDRFRARIIFPIRELRGHVAGFGGRVLDDSLPKYMNSPQTDLFDKGSILYGIDVAKDWIRRGGRAVIVEGYMDVLMAHQHGIQNVVASMGTALTERQVGILKRLTRTVTLALDADLAGDEGTLRGLDVAKQVMSRRTVPVLTGRGLIRYEDRLDADIQIMTLPEDRDPDEIIREDPSQWRALVEEALPVMDYYFQALTKDLHLDTAKGKRTATERLLPLVGELGNIVEREHYLQHLARLTKVDERALGRQMLRLERHRGVETHDPPREENDTDGPPSRRSLEEYCLSMLLREPYLLDEEHDFGADDFLAAENRVVYLALQQSHQQKERFDIGSFVDTLDIGLRRHVESLLQVEEAGGRLTEEQLREAFSKLGRRLSQERDESLYRELGFLLQDAQEQGDAETVRSIREEMRELVMKRRLHERRAHASTMLGRQHGEAH